MITEKVVCLSTFSCFDIQAGLNDTLVFGNFVSTSSKSRFWQIKSTKTVLRCNALSSTPRSTRKYDYCSRKARSETSELSLIKSYLFVQAPLSLISVHSYDEGPSITPRALIPVSNREVSELSASALSL